MSHGIFAQMVENYWLQPKAGPKGRILNTEPSQSSVR